MEYYKIVTPTNSHYAVLKPSNTGQPEIVLGGQNYICISISAPNNDLNIRTDPVCYLGEEFPNQPTDAKEMLLAAIFLTKHVYRETLCNIELTDLSDKGGMALSSLMIVFHQQTWYQKWFGAYLKNPVMQKTYSQVIQRFHDPDFKETSKYFQELLQQCKMKITLQEDIIHIYKATSTYKEFFNKLREAFNPPEIYIMLKPWLNLFTDRLGLGLVRREIWVIPCGNHDFTNYSIETLTSDPYNGKYVFVTRKQIGGNIPDKCKKLSAAERVSLQMPNWIGWLYIKDIEDYCDEDKEYIKTLQELQN